MHNLSLLIQSLKHCIVGCPDGNTRYAGHLYGDDGMNRHMHEETMLMLSQKQA